MIATSIFFTRWRRRDSDSDGISVAADALSLNGGAIRDEEGQNASLDLGRHAISNDDNHKVDGSQRDTVAPSVREVEFETEPQNGDTYALAETIEIRVQFDERVMVSGTPQLALRIGTATRAVDLDGKWPPTLPEHLYFLYEVQAADLDGDGISIAADALSLNGATIRDSAGNDADLDLGEHAINNDAGYKVDGRIDRAPRVTDAWFETEPAVDDTYAVGEEIRFAVVFSEPVAVTGAPQLELTFGSTETRTADFVWMWENGEGVVFRYLVHAADRAPDGISIAADALRLNGATIRDSGGNDADVDLGEHAISNDAGHRVDGSIDNPPVVQWAHLDSRPATGDTYAFGETIVFDVSFSKPVTVTGTPQLRLMIGTATRTAEFGELWGSGLGFGLEYEVQAADLDHDGISIAADALSLPNGATIRDSAGNDADLDLAEYAISNDADHKVDGRIDRPPVVKWVRIDGEPQSGGTYGVGEVIEVHVGFNEPVTVMTVSGTPQLELSIGTDMRTVDLDTVCCEDRMDHLKFRYTVQTADRDADGISIAADALQLSGGTIRDRGGNDADLDLGEHTISNDADHKVDGSIDRPPMVTWMDFDRPPGSDNTYSRGEIIRVNLGFSERVVVTGTPRLTLTIGTATRTVAMDHSWSDGLAFLYEVQADDSDSDGISIAANALRLNGATIRDSGGNDADLDLGEEAITNDADRKVDGSIVTAPRIRDIYFRDGRRPASGDTYELGGIVEVHVAFDKSVTVTGTPQLALTVGTQTRQMACNVLWNNRFLFCVYTVQATDRDEDGVSVAADSLTLNDGTIKFAGDGTTDADLRHDPLPADPNRKVDGSQVSVPTVREIRVELPASGGTYELGESIRVWVDFDRQVNVSSAPQLALIVGTETRQMIAIPRHLGRRWDLLFTYTVQAADRDEDGISIPADPLHGGVVTHLHDSTIGADLTHEGLPDDPNRQVDGRRISAPKVEREPLLIWSPENGTYERGEKVSIFVYFDKPVEVTGTPRLALTVGTRVRHSYYSQSWQENEGLFFQYVVQADDRDEDGISIAANALDTGGGSITLASRDDVEAVLTHGAVDDAPEYKVDGSSVSAAPTVDGVWFNSFPKIDRTYQHGEIIEVWVGFDKSVDVTGTPRLALTIGTQTRHAAYHRTELGRRLYFRYSVQAGDRDDDGISIAANALDAGDGAITLPGSDDAVDADLRLPALPDNPAHKVDAGPQIGCKQPGALAARVQPLPAEAAQNSDEGQAHAFELALELEENRDGSGQAVQIGCVALVAGDRRFSYAITDGNDGSRFAVGTSDGMISYVGNGENAERTPEYLLTVTAAPQDAGEPAHLPVRIAIADVNDPGIVTLSATQPVIGQPLTAALDDEDRGVQDASWQWWRQAPNGEWTEIQDATAAGYTPVSADAGHSLQARVTYADEHGAQQAASAPTETVDLDALRRERILRLGLAGFGRTVASAAVNAIGQRFGPATAAGEPGTVALDATLNRQPLHFPNAGDAVASGRLVGSVTRALGVRVMEDETVVFNPPSGAALLANSAFSVEYSRGAGRWGVWGSGDLSGFQGKVDGFEQDGSVLSAYLGADYRFVPNALAGIAASYSQLDLTSTSDTDGEATLKGTLIAAYPYGFWMPEEWLGLWGLAGFGTGTAELEDSAGSQDGDIRMWLGATGQRVELLSSGGLSLAAKSDGFVTGLTADGGLPVVSANAWRARLLLEGGLEWRPDLSRLAGSVEVGARLDGGDAEQGLGAEAGAELSYAHTGIGLMISGRGRILLAHEDDNLRDWGVSAMLRWEPPALGSGPALAITPVWGVPESGVMALWQDWQAVLAGLNSGSPAGNGARWLPDLVAVKLSYGVEMPAGGRLVPYAEIDFGESAARRVRAGATVDISDPAASHGLLLEAFGQHEARDGVPSYHFGLEGTLEY